MKIIQIMSAQKKDVLIDKRVINGNLEIYGLGDDGVLYKLHTNQAIDSNSNPKWVKVVGSDNV